MTIRLSFDLSAVHELAEHAAAAAGHLHPAGSTATGPALLLSGGSNSVRLTSNGLPAPQPPADQPATLSRPAAFASQRPPGTPWPEQVMPLRGETELAGVLPLHEPAGNPLIAQLRNAAHAGFTTLTVILCGTGSTRGLDIAVSRHRHRDRSRRPVDA